MRALSERLPGSIRSLVSIGLIAIAVALGVGGNNSAGAATTFTVGAGVGSGTVAGNVFAPGEITVNVGDTVTWSIDSGEPHTVTFGSVPAGQDPTAFTTFTGAPPNLGANDYNGTGVVSTGLAFNGFSASVHFTAEGNYGFGCEIHPGMNGTVHVKAAGQAAETQAQLDAKAAQTKNAILAAVDPLVNQTSAEITKQGRADGTTQWTIFANATTDPAAQPGGGTGYLELVRYIPAEMQIGAGDTVTWQASAPHTVTFLPPNQTADQLEGQYGGNPFAVPPAKPSDKYDSTKLYSSGILVAGPPGTPKSFTLTFPNVGTFPYLCLIHHELGQTGTITVAEKSSTGPVTLPNTGGPPDDGGGGSGWLLWTLLGAAALGAAGAAGLTARKLKK